ncbi:hypothetical protein Daura_17900 [Dactylosporangium aurantiacum]|uniref:HTH luxR-type domain-containing protein n=1 Tax=Dactylosporangium aurantiacum TaxID=35754 RepID=A0A9Q9IR37_9ACTN|nr:LuxR C-terminal-related transcriptional regulator [Dactylosporangium aurantiacum]UWZ57874.1 hypothetical protein Daura_17900 [Dactylosporangium aurantiacum]
MDRAVYVDLHGPGAATWWQSPSRAPAWWPASAGSVDELCDRLTGAGPGGPDGTTTVVLDGTEAVTDPRFLPQVRHVAARTGAVRVVLVGRHAPPDGAAGTGTPARRAALGRRDLAFTAAETAAICRLRGLDLAPADCRRLYAVTGGWAGGLMVAITALTAERYDAGAVIDRLQGNGAGLAEYVLHDVLREHPADVRQAVLDASVADAVCADLFASLTGHRDAAGVLEALARDEMFAVPLEHGSVWYHVPRMWRTDLYVTLSQWDPARARRLHGVAASWFAAHELYAEALRHALAAEDRSLAVRLAYRHDDAIRAATVQAAPTAEAPRPWSSLASDRALAYAFDLLRPATDGGEPSRFPEPRWWPVNRGFASAPHRDRATIDRKHNSRDVGHVTGPSPGTVATIWQLLRQGDFTAARQSLSAFRAQASAGPVARSTVLRLHMVTERMAGRLGDAARTAEQLRGVVRADGVVGAVDEGWARLTLAETAVQRGDRDAALRHLDALAVELWQAVPALVAGQRLQAAVLLQQQHDHAVALRHVQELIADGDDRHLVPRWAAHVLRAELLLAMGRADQAGRHWSTDAVGVPAAAATITAARLVLAGGGDAAGLLRPLLDEPGTSLFQQVEILLLLSRQALLSGDTTAAAGWRRQAERRAAAEGVRHPFQADAGLPVPAPPPPATEPDAVEILRSGDDNPALTPSELAVLHHLPGHRTVPEIAAVLHLSLNTVKTHTASIYRKLSVHRRRDAVRAALDLGLLPAVEDNPPPVRPGTDRRPAAPPG